MKTKRWNNLSFFLIQKLLQINFRWANDRNSKRIILYHNLYEINSEIFLYTFSVYRDFHFSVCSQFRRDALPDFFRDIPVSRYQGLFGHFYAGLYGVGLGPVWFANLFRVKFKIESIESLEMSLKWFAHVNQKKKKFLIHLANQNLFYFSFTSANRNESIRSDHWYGVIYAHFLDVPKKTHSLKILPWL